MKKLIRRTIHPEVKVIDQEKGIVEYVASDETLDYHREVIRAGGWRFTNFRKNSPLVDSHDYTTVEKLLGEVTDFYVKGGQLINRARFALDAPAQTLATKAWQLVSGGYLKACSVGFMPVSFVTKWDDEKRWLAAVRELRLTPEAAAIARTIYLEQEQLELSVCIIGANPMALAKAYKEGVLSDDDLSLLDTISQTDRKTATRADDPGHAHVARGRAAWLRKLKTIIKS